MVARNLGRTTVLIAVLAVILSMGWWAMYYNEIIRPLGNKGDFVHPMRCLLWTADVCTKPQQGAVAVHGFAVQPYMPMALWISLGVLLLGLLLVYASSSNRPYPVTPVDEAKPIIGRLEPFYVWTRDLSWLVIRLTVGGTLLVHGINKVMGQPIADYAAKSMAPRGLEPAVPLTYLIYFLETGGALLIMLGLFTRIIAPMLAIQFFIITFVAHFGRGFGWTNPGGGWEFPLLWGLMFFAIALRGGGPYSLDRLLRREL